jgi:hypothetical protein
MRRPGSSPTIYIHTTAGRITDSVTCLFIPDLKSCVTVAAAIKTAGQKLLSELSSVV